MDEIEAVEETSHQSCLFVVMQTKFLLRNLEPGKLFSIPRREIILK